jgi:hypothetical protein
MYTFLAEKALEAFQVHSDKRMLFLRRYVKGTDRSGEELLFPSQTGEMIADLRKPLGTIATEVGMETPRLTKFRHTYATARLQTTDENRSPRFREGSGLLVRGPVVGLVMATPTTKRSSAATARLLPP